MKKLIVLTLALAVAVVASASSVKWQFVSSSTYAGYTVYICSSITDGGFTSLSDIQSHLLGTSGNSGTISGSRTVQASGVAGGLTDDAGTTVNFYYVIVNPEDSTGYWTIGGSAEAYTTATTHTDSSLPKATTDALLSTAKTAWATGGGGGGTDPAPEPTSGILLLVGAGILGLRRKRA